MVATRMGEEGTGFRREILDERQTHRSAKLPLMFICCTGTGPFVKIAVEPFDWFPQDTVAAMSC